MISSYALENYNIVLVITITIIFRNASKSLTSMRTLLHHQLFIFPSHSSAEVDGILNRHAEQFTEATVQIPIQMIETSWWDCEQPGEGTKNK